LAVVLLVLPGFVFATVRRRLQGPTPADGDFAYRLLTAIVVGAVLDATYVLVGGRHLTSVLADRGSWQQHPRQAVLLGLALLVVVPALLAFLDDRRRHGRFDIPLMGGKRLRLQYTGQYDPTPTAWDYIAEPRAGTFVRVQQEGGSWVGGWFGTESFLSVWPEPRDLFIESQWRIGSDGAFVEKLEGTRGVYVSCSGNVIVEWIKPPDDTAPADEGSG